MEHDRATPDAEHGTFGRPSPGPGTCCARLMEAIPVGLILIGKDGRVRHANGRSGQIFGYDCDALLDTPVDQLIPDRFRSRIDLNRCRVGCPSPAASSKGRYLAGLRADGTEFPLEFGLHALGFAGEPMVLACVSDLTARIENDEENARTQLELDQSNNKLDEFLVTAHPPLWRRFAG